MPSITPRQRQALVALAESYLLPHPQFRAEPATYDQVGLRIGATRKRAEKLIAEVRRRFIDAALPGLTDLADARGAVCETALALRLIDASSLAVLDAAALRLADDTDAAAG